MTEFSSVLLSGYFLLDIQKCLCHSFLFFQTTLTGNHNSLSLGASGPMHGFRQITYSGCTHGHIFYKPEYFKPVSYGKEEEAARYFSMNGPVAGLHRSFSEGAVTIRPPAIS